jgi:hypothetical protein
MPELNACIICGKEVEGELKLRKGWLAYDKGGFGGITHRHNTPEFYEIRSRNQRNKPKAVEQALERLLLHPNDKKALQTLHEWRSRKLFDLATDPRAGMAGIRASEKLLEEYLGEPETQKLVHHSNSTAIEKPEIIVHILEPGQMKLPPRYMPPTADETEDDAYDTRDDDEFDSHAEALEPEEPEQIKQKRSLAKPLYGPTIIIGPDGSNWGWTLSKEELAAKRRPINPYALRR